MKITAFFVSFLLASASVYAGEGQNFYQLLKKNYELAESAGSEDFERSEFWEGTCSTIVSQNVYEQNRLFVFKNSGDPVIPAYASLDMYAPNTTFNEALRTTQLDNTAAYSSTDSQSFVQLVGKTAPYNWFELRKRTVDGKRYYFLKYNCGSEVCGWRGEKSFRPGTEAVYCYFSKKLDAAAAE